MNIKDIKSSLLITDVLAMYGLKADRNGMLRCPFHDDQKASLQVYPKTNSVYCFSPNCKLKGKAADVIDVIMHYENITKHEALLKATDLASIGKLITHKTETMTPNPPTENLTLLFHSLRQKFYRGSIAQNYAKSRNLDHKKLELGFNPYHNKEFKKLQNCLIFPLKDIDDKVVSLYGRSTSKNPHSKHFYLKNRTGLYPRYPGQETKTLIITEAIVDAATLISHLPFLQTQAKTNYSILSLFGSNGWREEHTEAIKRIKDLEEVIFFMDGDPAGQKVIKTYAGLVMALTSHTEISQVETPESEDVNSLLDAHSSEIFTHLIQKRVPVTKSSTVKPKDESFLFSPEEKPAENNEARQVDSLRTNHSDPDSSKENKKPTEEQASQDNSPSEPATPQRGLPDLPALNLDHPDYIRWTRTDMAFTVIGGLPLYPIDRMVLTLGIKKLQSNRPLHSVRQKINLYQDDIVEKFARKVAERLEIGTTRVHESLLELTSLLEGYRKSQHEKLSGKNDKKRNITLERIKAAKAFASAPNLHKRTNDMIGKAGMIGEEINRMILWYVFSSRLMETPLHVMCLGASGTGKTYLQSMIGKLIPEDQKIEITAMSDNAVYYFEEDELKHKLLLIEDLDGANEEKVLYALRELMSKTEVSKTIPIKDNKGEHKTITLKVKGPICLAGTTTRERLYEDNANRSLLIYLDTSKAQKLKIMEFQRMRSAGRVNKYAQDQVIEFLKDVQSILQPINVVNPYAMDLTMPEEVFKPLRTNQHYLLFIEAVTFVHQLQRSVKTDSQGKKYIESTIEDIEIANELMKDVLLAKSDELSKSCRMFLERIKHWTKELNKESFYRKEVRESFRMNPNNVRYYLTQLTKYGYVKIVGGSKHRSGYEYEVTKKNEYAELGNRINTVLDETLKRIRKKYEPASIEKKSVESVDNSCELA